MRKKLEHEITTRCASCGRFMSPLSPGTSSWQTWTLDMSGDPDLHDPIFQCAPCTKANGYKHSNCGNPERYQWLNH
jgi:hypothetical protein